MLSGNGQEIAGVQWPLNVTLRKDADLWFYHGADLNRMRTILREGHFPPTRPYSSGEYSNDLVHGIDIVGDVVVESLPDGSFFGIGREPLRGLFPIDRREADIPRLNIGRLMN